MKLASGVLQTARQTLTNMRRGLTSAPSQGWHLAVRDIRIEYVQTKLGLFWAFIEPLVIAFIFVALRRNGILEINGLNMPFALFAVCGILIWQTFFDSLMLSLTSLQRAGSLIGNYAVAPESLIASMALRSLFMLAMRLPIIIGLTVAFGFFNWANTIIFIFLSPIAMFAGLALGLLIAPFTLASADLKIAVGVISRPLMYLSGAIFPLTGGLEIFRHYNPIAVIIENLRLYLINGQFADASALTIVTLFVIGMYIFAAFAFHRTMRTFL